MLKFNIAQPMKWWLIISPNHFMALNLKHPTKDYEFTFACTIDDDLLCKEINKKRKPFRHIHQDDMTTGVCWS